MRAAFALALGRDPSVEPSPPVQSLLVALVGAGIVYNNLLRWYPFPAGRSANDLTTLDTALPGIVVNVLLYAALAGVVAFSRSSQLRLYRSRLLEGFCLYLALQAPFRANPWQEAARSFSMIVMLLSADWVAAVVISSPRCATRFLHNTWRTMVGTVAAGLLIGLVWRDSVNWGSDLSPSFAQTQRAEFFFFYVLPQYAFALSLAIVASARRWQDTQVRVAVGAAMILPVLALLTMTRTIMFSLLLVGLVFLFRYARKALLMAGAIVLAVTMFWPAARANLLERLRLSDFVAAGRTVNEATGGRLQLVRTNLQSFIESPVFGQGAVETRRRAWASDSVAKTEQGYSLHLASSGIFSLLLFAYVIQGLIAGIRIVLSPGRAPNSTTPGPYAIAIAALAMASFFTGFFWTFSSATAFYEWFAVFFVSASRVTWQTVQLPESHPTRT